MSTDVELQPELHSIITTNYGMESVLAQPVRSSLLVAASKSIFPAWVLFIRRQIAYNGGSAVLPQQGAASSQF
ncbi:hypothetical protein HJG54_11675 [Leptolyngbya sp. NK1-12]|uniref:Uncharacterized protein n=1 Tax=Leptolyngbya sp. NK1-12 TaxID=2547451 RepID=A0AA97AK94_9CYAN|nr:hypothetical protein [Leptolyngbya sp. NK1-12]WNZ23447.1 hypothetical protein HJG54_11675 [Leptolyngbya sp. NK1-12]